MAPLPCLVWLRQDLVSLRDPGLQVSGQGWERGCVILDRPNYSILARPFLALMLAPDFALISAVHDTLHVDAGLLFKKEKVKKWFKAPLPLHFPDLFHGCLALTPPLRPSLSCFQLNYNLVLGHFVRHSAWNLTNIGAGVGGGGNKWDATGLKGIQHFKVETHLRVAFLLPK